MSRFISFEPLFVPVSMLLPICRLALDETFESRPASDSHTLLHDKLAGGAGGGGGGERQVPGQQQGEILIMQTSKAKSPHASTGGLAVADTHHDTQLTFVGILCRVCCAR